jgi:hypothetical protein
VSRAAQAAIYAATGLPGAKQAFAFLDGEIRKVANVRVAWQSSPVYFLSPVLSAAPAPTRTPTPK